MSSNLETMPSFGKTFIWVLAVHVLALLALIYFRFPDKLKESPVIMEVFELPSPVKPALHTASLSAAPAPLPLAHPAQVSTSIASPPISSHPRPTAPVEAQPAPPVEQPVPQPKIETPLAPVPVVVPSEIVVPQKSTLQDPKPKKETAAPNSPQSPPTTNVKKHNQIVPNLEMTTKSSSSSSTSAEVKTTENPSTAQASHPPNSSQGGHTVGVSEGDIAGRLHGLIKAQGLDQGIGKVAVSSEGGNSQDFGSFYKVISDQMHEAWKRPTDLAGFHQTTVIQIHVAADGSVSEPKILSSSGNSSFDQSALQAAQSVHKLHQPRPEGCADLITINFRLAD